MNNKLLLIPLVSLGAIVQLPQSAHAQAFSADSVKNPEPSLEVSETPHLGSVDQPAAVRSIAAPEVINDRTNTLRVEVPQAPAQVSVQVRQDPTIALTVAPIVAAQPIAAKPIVVQPIAAEPIVAKPIVQTIAQASDPSAIVAQVSSDPSAMPPSIPVKIEVGSRGIPPITSLPERIALPPVGLLPGNFELPINIQQVVDSSISTSSPITDRLADPVLSTQANPNSPSAIGPIVNERLRTTVDEMQAYRSAYSQNLVAWSDRVRQCMGEKPRMYVLRSDGAQLPVFFNGQEGTVVRNASGQAVCTN